MEVFEYKVSVIVPVYNAEKYLRDCLDSLLFQSLPQNEMEVLLINDGSIDSSEKICKEYCKFNRNFKLYSKENEGLSATRNYGIKRANGKYIAYLDADDTYSSNTLKNVCAFFDVHYDEIDEVTIPIIRYKNGKSLPLHFRYKYETRTGIYDLDSFPYISQTTINIIVKNKRKNNILFDTTPNFRQEDQEYNNNVLSEKMKIGFVKEAEYKYNRDNETSIINTYMYPYYIFETSIKYFENLFSKYQTVPKYYQAMFINDLNWKLNEDKLWPFHYSAIKYKNAVDRIKKLLIKVDTDIIVNHPLLNNFHIQYWLSLKENCDPTIVADKGMVKIFVNGESIYKRNNFEIILHKIRVDNKKARILGFVKSPIYNYVEGCAELYIVKDGIESIVQNMFLSVHSYYKSQYTKTNNFWAFDIDIDVSERHEIYFEVKFEGIRYSTKFWCMPVAIFDTTRNLSSYVRDNVIISLKKDQVIEFEPIDNAKMEEIESARNEYYKNEKSIYVLREQALNYRKNHKVWLYYDAYTVKKDNGFYQFTNDIKHKDDGIEKYYVITNPETKNLFDEELKKYVIDFGSYVHKLLYISAERIFTAFYGFSTISPFKTEKNEADYIDLIKFKTIYLQHGVLHAALRTYNSVERCRAEQIVISSEFEKNNYMQNYNYRESDLIPVGMARYDVIDKKRKPKNKILYAPSWRKYLTYSQGASNWTTVVDKLLESDYFIGICNFINSDKLISVLEKNGLTLDVKLHPIIAKDIEEIIELKSDRVSIVKEEVSVEDYKLFITDFSSYVFDYACLCRPIVYYVTDYEQFKSGMNHYKELDLPFDKAFGNMFTDFNSVIDEIERLVSKKFQPDIKYYDRMNTFFYSLDNCAERLYRYIKNKDLV